MTNEQADTETEVPDDGMRKMPTDPPEVVPAISSEQFGIAAGLGLAGFAKQNPDGGFVGDEEEAWHVQDPDAARDAAQEAVK
jgi:hypothetical protein